MKKVLFTFSIMQNCDEIVCLIPFRLVTSRRQQIVELERECNRLLLAQKRLERMESSHFSSPCSVGAQSNSSYYKSGERKTTQLVALILFLTSPLMTKPNPEASPPEILRLCVHCQLCPLRNSFVDETWSTLIRFLK